VELLQLRDDTKKTKTSSSSNAEEEEDAAGDDASSSVPKRTTAAAAAFAELLATDPDAFENVYVTFFETLDAEWLSQEATYTEFNVVMKATTKKVKAALEKVGRRRDGGERRAREAEARVAVMSQSRGPFVGDDGGARAGAARRAGCARVRRRDSHRKVFVRRQFVFVLRSSASSQSRHFSASFLSTATPHMPCS
jgi:hypothetical protein